MQSKWYAILATLVGILLVLPLIGVEALGTVTEGISAWIIALAVLLIGIIGLVKTLGK